GKAGLYTLRIREADEANALECFRAGHVDGRPRIFFQNAANCYGFRLRTTTPQPTQRAEENCECHDTEGNTENADTEGAERLDCSGVHEHSSIVGTGRGPVGAVCDDGSDVFPASKWSRRTMKFSSRAGCKDFNRRKAVMLARSAAMVCSTRRC